MIVDGVELLRIIKNRDIKAGTKIIWGKQNLYFDGDNIVYSDTKQKLLSILWDFNFVNADFEILSEQDEEIDIDEIEDITKRIRFNYDVEKYTDNEINNNFYQITEIINEYIDKQNEILKAVKQLNKQINKGE